MSTLRLCERNLKMYFRDKTAVFFSLLAVLIVIVLYILFLAQIQIDAVVESTNNIIDENNVSYLINSWILAGLLSITTVTSTLGGYGIIVEDVEKRKRMDFKSSPLSSMKYPSASVLSCIAIGTIISCVALAVYTLYIFITTGYCFGMQQFLQCIGFILLSSSMSATLLGFVVSFIKTSNGFSSISLVVGTVIGFLNGLYVPMGSLPEVIQNVLKCLPFGHIASVFRKILMKDSIKLCFEDFPDTVMLDYKKIFGVDLQLEDYMFDTNISVLYISIVTVVFIILYFISYSKKRREL